MSHSITEHKTVDEIIAANVSWEDQDTWAIVGITENEQFEVTLHWSNNGCVADSLLEAFYLVYGPDCHCDTKS